MKIYFKTEIYRHHKCSVVFIIVFSCGLILASSFIPDFPVNNGESYINSFQVVKELFGHELYFLIIIPIFIIRNFGFSFSTIVSKILFEINFVSRHILIIFIGAIGFFINLFIALITIYFENKDKYSLLSYFNDLNDRLTENKQYEFYGEIFLVFPLFSISKFFQIYFEMLVIYYLNPIFILITNNLCYSISGIVFYAFNPNFIRFTSFILTEFTDIISLIGYCIYLEIIELNFCGLSNNLRRKIKDKGESEVNDIILGKIGNNDDLFSLNNEEDESRKNTEIYV
jgi:hypothetical protein